ncbi:hypothetical protein PCANC_06567 [Puccinia coronata f. sp. avenae]|uniref:Uncharacterized protein n=1 Tax=Puccinia coronata f. sp. avenae TaxID=200324 RepID=A0A2N5VA10_9BASI|nr:hypothetical protein PCANC_06567 [Puccinia coronata f. sp. avenae]
MFGSRYISTVVTPGFPRVARKIGNNHMFTYTPSNLLNTSIQIESLASYRIHLNEVQEWALILKSQHFEIPSSYTISPKWNEMTGALHSLVDKARMLNTQTQWEIRTFSDEYEIMISEGSKMSATRLTNELSRKLLGVTKLLLQKVGTTNMSISEFLRLHDDLYYLLTTSQIQVQNELRKGDYVGFKYLLGSEWRESRHRQLVFQLAGLKLLQETGFRVRELRALASHFQQNLDVLEVLIVGNQKIKNGKNRGLQVILNSFFTNNQPGKTTNDP